MRPRLVKVVQFLVFIGLGFGILYLVYRNQQAAYAADCALRGIPAGECSLLDKVIADFGTARPGWLLLTLLAFCISNLSRALRWNMLLRTFGRRPRLVNAFLTINLGYLANLGFPRLGEVVRPATMARYEDMRLERVVGTVVVGRIVDVVCILLVSALALLMAGDLLWGWLEENASVSERLAGTQWLLTSVVALTIGGLGLAWFQRRRIAASRLGGKVVGILRGFTDGLRTVADLKRPVLYVLHTVNIWLMYFLMTVCVFQAYGPTQDLGLEAALVTFVSGGWGIVVPSPGGMGSYHYLAQSALGLYGVAGEDAFAWANISFFSINIGCNVLIGLLALLVLPRINRSYTPR